MSKELKDQNDKKDCKVIKVTVRKGAAPDTYDVTFDDNSPKIKKKNTKMEYELTEDSAPEVKFTGSSAKPGGEMGPATVGKQGRSISFNNANTKKETVEVQLDMEGDVEFYVVPEVINEPQPG